MARIAGTTTNGSAGPTSNGQKKMLQYSSPPESPIALSKSQFRTSVSSNGRNGSLSMTSRSQTNNNTNNSHGKLEVVQDTAAALQRKSMSELGAGVSQSTTDTSFIDFVSWIRTERLSTLPHKGSRWDTVLIRALYFAEQLHGFETAVQDVAYNTRPAAQMGYGHARLLLEVSQLISPPCPILMHSSLATRTPKLSIRPSDSSTSAL